MHQSIPVFTGRTPKQLSRKRRITIEEPENEERNLNKVSSASPKLSKFACWLMNFPYLIPPSRGIPITAYINMTRKTTAPTLATAGRVNLKSSIKENRVSKDLNNRVIVALLVYSFVRRLAKFFLENFQKSIALSPFPSVSKHFDWFWYFRKKFHRFSDLQTFSSSLGRLFHRFALKKKSFTDFEVSYRLKTKINVISFRTNKFCFVIHPPSISNG